ncbi:MAG: replicative DNA helicase [Dysgonamonadaceae bacterium]|jgi:replicative DNA helicase|nr:replicative DNA helicase [Dysgonamonadaceae bacterium]
MAKQEFDKSRNQKKKATAKTEETGRKQPQAPELEEAILGALMLEKDAFQAVSDTLTPESFYLKTNGLIFKAIQSLAHESKPIDILTVVQQLKKEETLEEVGGASYIAELSQKVVSSAHLDYHARIVAQKHLARELISFSFDTVDMAFDESNDVDDLMQTAEKNLFEITQRNIKRDVTHIDPILSESMSQILDRYNNQDKMSGVSCGFTELDKMTNGWQNGDLIIIAGRPAMGKTAFVLSMLKNMAVDMNTPIAMFSLEMPNIQLVNRLIMNVTQLEGDKIRSGRLAPYELQQLDSKIIDLYGSPIYIDDTASLSVFELRSKARRLVREHGIKCIFIDYLQLMNASEMMRYSDNRVNEVTMISKNLKALAKELNLPIIALSQLNREVEKRTNTSFGKGESSVRLPQLSDLRESGAIEQDADIVCFIHRPEYYKLYEDEHGNNLRGKAQIIVAKHRNGKTGEVILEFVDKYARFQNLNDNQLTADEDLKSRVNSLEQEMPAEKYSGGDSSYPF